MLRHSSVTAQRFLGINDSPKRRKRTLLKVVLFDMSDVQTGYRVLSFLGLGLLLMGTSVLYGKLSPVLLGRGREGGRGEGDAALPPPPADHAGAPV